jgi:hypothetical protein
MNKLPLIGALCASVIFGFITISSHAAPNDPSGGMCDGLDPSSGLFSICIQAYSARNRVEHLTSVGASEVAIGRAQAAVAEAIAMFEELGGGTIPGFGYEIGDTGPAGGIVFYLDGTGGGLEAAPLDQGDAEWGCEGTELSGADGTAIGTGAQNTADIVSGCTDPGTAAKVADAYEFNGYTDWFLPSRDELNELYLNKDVVGGFSYDYYWSSSESDSYKVGAWYQHFGLGGQNYVTKNYTVRVRAVRAF